ncbi:NUDIX domain-containing protein [Halosegnis longus]|uniref:NUDIX domain-containing protein n=1 Tax=Halosegnis longus TaxID=2216012 RepID=UPI00373FDD30
MFAPTDEILIVRRATDGGWELPGGRVDQNETATAGLCRELTEETSIDPTVVTPVHTLVWKNEAGNGRFGVYYYCRAGDRSVSLSSEHDAYQWATVSETRPQLSEPQQTAVDAALRKHQQIQIK